LLLMIFAAAAAFFVFGGGLKGLTVFLAGRAVAKWDEPHAEQWLDRAEWFGAPTGDSLFYRARLARRNGDLEQMQDLLREARKAGCDQQRIDKELLLAKTQIGQLEGAEAELSRWLQAADVDSRDICSSFANGLAIAGRIEQATEVLNAWASDFPADPRPWFRLGRLDEHQQDYDAAEERYRNALARDPKYLPALYSMGRMLTNRRRIPDAVGYYEQCLQSPNPVAAEIGLAACLKATGEIDRAKVLLEHAITVDTDRLRDSYRQFEEMFDPTLALAELGKIEADLGNFARAAELLEKALAANPRDNVVRLSYATALRGLGRTEESQAEFEKVRIAREELAKATLLVERVAKNPSDVEARIELGKIHLEYDSEQRGLFWLRTVFSYDPDNRETHLLLSDYFDSQRDQHPEFAELAAEHRQKANAASQEGT
jgi:tetratricopeptide (TPR) repeat protein